MRYDNYNERMILEGRNLTVYSLKVDEANEKFDVKVGEAVLETFSFKDKTTIDVTLELIDSFIDISESRKVHCSEHSKGVKLLTIVEGVGFITDARVGQNGNKLIGATGARYPINFGKISVMAINVITCELGVVFFIR